MSYKEVQKEKAIKLRDEIFRDSGTGLFKKIPREFVLSEPELNLWEGIRADAIEYYKDNQISWWESGDEPTGHLLSSQIACINHLYFLRQREDLATIVLSQIDSQIQKALIIDSGYVEFEKVGSINLGKEKSLTRGANCTSIDAMIMGENIYGERTLFLIEWKFTESYTNESKFKGLSGERRIDAYKDLLKNPECPIIHENIKDLYHEPFYQLMRQTLLGWDMVTRKEYNAKDWVHLHIIPEDNIELKNKITSPGLSGRNIEEAWKSVLKYPDKYIMKSPDEFLLPIIKGRDTRSIILYLRKRYW